jgi:hypothetical protein
MSGPLAAVQVLGRDGAQPPLAGAVPKFAQGRGARFASSDLIQKAYRVAHACPSMIIDGRAPHPESYDFADGPDRLQPGGQYL